MIYNWCIFLACFAFSSLFSFSNDGLDNIRLVQSSEPLPVRFLPTEGSWGEANKNEVYLELGGVSGLYSINYTRYLYSTDVINLGARASFGNILFEKGLGLDYTIGLGAQGKYSLANRHHVEFGIGEVVYRYNILDFFEDDGTKTEVEFWTYFNVGYTFNFTKGFFMKAQYTPLILLNEPEVEGAKFQSWGGLSIGYSF